MYDIFRTLDLSYLGDNWKGCYIKFYAFTVEELNKLNVITPETKNEEALRIVINLLASKFVSGRAIKDGAQVDVLKDDLKNFPVDVLNDAISMFREPLAKKKLNPSTTPSEV